MGVGAIALGAVAAKATAVLLAAISGVGVVEIF
jgi:hypothetical protein